MKSDAIEAGARTRHPAGRTSRIVWIVLAIAEAILMFGLVVPALLKGSRAGDRPHQATGASHDRSNLP